MRRINPSVGRAGVLLLVMLSSAARAEDLADPIRRLDPIVLSPLKDDADHYRNLLPARINAAIKEANAKSTREWRAINSLEAWQAFRAAKLEALRRAIGFFPDPPKDLNTLTTRTHEGEGFKIECLVFESRPRFLVTANLYVPDPLPTSAPGIIIHPSHHNPKSQSELQDMGMTWARAGCYVLIMDAVGHGERAAHPFSSEQSYPKPFRVGRQDYWFRYNTGMQLHLVGDSLIGWQVYDLMRGVDLLLTRKKIDRKRIIMMGSVAGGGDPVAVTAALDDRIAGAVVFNFGGPQPETRYPLPEDAEEKFNYAGSGSWESTRNISFSARDGFLPWVIVGSIAPRKLIYAHEFAWDQERDPVWKRLQQIYAWNEQPDALAFTHGHGSVRDSGENASHCNNIGAQHRKHIYPALKNWFNIPEPKQEYAKRRPAAELRAMTDELKRKREALELHEVAARVQHPESTHVETMTQEEATRLHRMHWVDLLGDIAPPPKLNVESRPAQTILAGKAALQRFVLEIDGLQLPVLLLLPAQQTDKKLAVTIMIAQHGKAAFLKERSLEIAGLLQKGIAVCLPDVRGTGELHLDRHRGRTSWDTGISSSALMLGTPMLGQRLRDLRAVIQWLRSRDEVDAKRLALWGDSFAPVNALATNVRVPHGANEEPGICEPLGGMLALLGALFEDDVKAIFVHRAMFPLDGAVDDGFLHIPHDVIVPGVVRSGVNGASSIDKATMVFLAVTKARSIRIAAPVDALNQPLKQDEAQQSMETPIRRLAEIKNKKIDFQYDEAQPQATNIVAWLVERLIEE